MSDLLEHLFSCNINKLKTIFHDIDVNYVIPETDGCTSLHILAGTESTSRKEEVLLFLLKRSADPNARSFEDLTPVHIAAMWNNCLELEKLLQHGGNPWLTDNDNKNSFDMAADNKAYEAYQLLNIYHAQDKLNFKMERKTSNISENAIVDLVKIKEFLNKNEVENSKCLSVTQFMSANEHFPLLFSSSEDENSDILSMSKYLKKKNLLENKTSDLDNSDANDSLFITKQNDVTINLNFHTANNTFQIAEKNDTNKFNQAYLYSSSETETVDSESFDELDISNETIIGMDEKNGIILVESSIPTVTSNIIQSYCGRYDSRSSLYDTESDWKSYSSEYDDSSTISCCSSCSNIPATIPRDFHEFSNSKIFQELRNMGDNPGPVLDNVRLVYLKRLAKLKHGCKVSCDLPKPKYPPEIYLYLKNKLDMVKARILEKSIADEFDQDAKRKWREGNQRCCFNYFLLDPRVTRNLPSRACFQTPEQSFLVFLNSLFYVGKGTRGRPYSHLFEAAKSLNNDNLKSGKINHILDIWEAGLGVISLHCFHNSIPVEAYTREACIIEAIGLDNLTNIRRGDFYGSCAQFTPVKKRLVGMSLLERAYQIFLLEGERQIKLKDIQNK